MKKIIGLCLKILCSTMGVFILFVVNVAMGTMSLGGTYEYEMPVKLIPKDGK